MRKYIILLLLCFPLLTQAQVTTLIGKTANQLAGSVVDLQTDLDAAYFNGFGQNDLYLRNGILERGISVSDYSTLAAAINAAESDSNFVVVAAASTITATDTVRAHAGLIFTGGGDSRVTISSGVVLYVNGAFWAPPNKRVFYGAGTVVFGPGVVSVVYPEWWGAKADSTTDSGTAFKAAYTAVPNGARIELLSGGRTLNAVKGYIINTTVRVPADKNTVLEGFGATIYSSASDTVFLLQNGSQTSLPSYAISPAAAQPRHHISNMRFRRILGNTGSGTAIALINTTGASFHNIDVYDYNNGIVFNNQSDGWCENNDLYNWRISSCDTAILYKNTLSGDASFATNSLRKVTMTGFTLSDVIIQNTSQAVGIYASASTNLYRNVWDQVVIFPKDSVTCVYLNGKAEDLTGTVNFEYIGSTETSRMRGFHFGSSSSELRFKLHMNLTGRIYFAAPNIFYSESPGTFGYSGITTTLDGNQNHGIEMVVDSSKFTPWFGVIKNSRLGMTTPADSGRILFGNFNNSGVNKLDIRGRRYGNNKASIDMRSLTDNVYSAATANSVDGSALPLLPVRLLDVGGNVRSIQDSTTIDVRNTTAMVIDNSSSTVPYTLSAFKGGIVGQTITVSFSSNKIYLANLRGSSGNGRLFLLENDSTYVQSGMKSFFRCESESGGVFWREMWRSAEHGKTTDFSTVGTDSIDAAQVNSIRLNHASTSALRNLFNGLDGQVVEILHRTANTRIAHLGRGSSKGFSLIDADSLVGFIGLRQVFQYDKQDDLWREVSRSSGLRTNQGTAWSKTLTESSTTNVVSIGVASGSYIGGYVDYTVFASDATDHQARQGRVFFQAVNKAGTETAVVSGTAGNANPTELQDGSSPAVSSGTLTYAWDTATTPTNGFLLRLNAVCSLTQSTLEIKYRVVLTSGTATVTPQ